MQAGEAVLMAGAGCSASLYPDWLSLIHLMHSEALQLEPAFAPFNKEFHNYLSYADELKRCLGQDRFYNVIFQCFKPKNSDAKRFEKFHQVLCRFLVDGKLRGITTTNYDYIFEDALTSVTGRNESAVRIDNGIARAKIFEFLFSLNKGGVPKRILHLHGVYDEPNSIILSGSEYEEKYGFKLTQSATTFYQKTREEISEAEFSALLIEFGLNWTQHRKILWSLFATRRLIFMGFSLSDPYFNQMLTSVSQDLHTYSYDNHYLVLRMMKDADKEKAFARAQTLKKNYGIETVFFEDDERGEGLSNFVFDLESSLNKQPNSAATEAKKKTPSVSDEIDPNLNQRLINLSRQR